VLSLKTITLNQKKTSPISLEFDELIPDEIYSWEKADFDKYMVPIGNSRFPLTDYFDIEVAGEATSPAEISMIIDGDASRIKYIGCKMSAGEILVKGSADLHCGAEMTGGKITVEGDADSYAGREMTGGELTIKGGTKEFTGSSYIGEWRGMSGGKISVYGNAGKQLGECLSGGEIYVKGDCDILAGIHMTKGFIQIDGDVTRWPGGQMKNGDILINGELGRLLEGFTQEGIVTDPEIEGRNFTGKYIKYIGDIALNGKGRLWLNAERNRHFI
jgi:formylmethanofuran dehydrogenase subunit C